MRIVETEIKDCYIINYNINSDDRGFFYESFNKNVFLEKTGIDFNMVQENESFSYKKVLRGLHFQSGEHTQAKIVRVTKGWVYDVCVDLRPNSGTFGKWVGIDLSSTDRTQFYIPKGCAHGFIVKSDYAIFNYKVDNFYNKQSEGGIIYNDPDLNINWGVEENDIIVSEKDKVLPKLKESYPSW